MRSSEEPKIFLVRIGEYFFAGFDKTWKPLGVATPSTAKHMTYRKADAVVQHLVQLKYENVCVTDVMGNFADLKTIQEAQQSRVGR